MDLRNLLNVIDLTAKENNLSKPYIVGGFPRDVFLKKLKNISDVDITCGDESSFKLGDLVVDKFKGANLTTFTDKHSKLKYENFIVDFSSNFKIPDINNILKRSNISKPTSMKEELYSRDFTANALLMPLDLSNILDETGLGFNDINNKILDTCLPPKLTFSYDPRRIIRVVYLSVKLDFSPSYRVGAWIRDNGKLLQKVGMGYIKNKLNKALKINPEKTLQIITSLNLMEYMPKTKLLQVALEKND
jgi:tRNA nucleotidyltransferase/poly(A) polymerase